MSEHSRPLSGLSVCVVGPLAMAPAGFTGQPALLCRMLARDGAQVRRLDNGVEDLAGAPQGEGVSWLLNTSYGLIRLPLLLWHLLHCQVVHVMVAGENPFPFLIVAALLLGRLLRRQVVLTWLGDTRLDLTGLGGRLAWSSLRRLDGLATLSTAQAQTLAYHGLDVTVLPPLVEAQRFPFRERSSWPPLLLWTADLHLDSDPLMAVRALTALRETVPQARLMMVGWGPMAQSIQALAREVGMASAISLKPEVPDHRLRQLMQTASVLWHTGSSGALPPGILEAAASGTVIVGTRIAALSELFEDGVDALLVEPGDHQALAAATTQVLKRSVLAQGLATNARLVAENHDWPLARGRLARLYGFTSPETSSVEDGDHWAEEETGLGDAGLLTPGLAGQTELLWAGQESPTPASRERARLAAEAELLRSGDDE